MNTPLSTTQHHATIKHEGDTIRSDKTRYILIHGIGQQKESWYTEALAAFPVDIREQVVPFYWADILNQGVAAHTVRGVSQILNVALRYYATASMREASGQATYALQVAAVRLLIPVLERWLDAVGDLMSYASVRVRAFARLQALIQQLELEGDGKVVLVAHSLGSVLAFEFCTLATPDAVQGFITLGSPLDREPVKRKSLNRTGGRVSLPIPWHNVWGTLDLVCCWRPWHSGEMNTFQPKAQTKIEGQGHGLEEYIRRIPAHLFDGM